MISLYFSDDVPDVGTDTTAAAYTSLLARVQVTCMEVNGISGDRAGCGVRTAGAGVFVSALAGSNVTLGHCI